MSDLTSLRERLSPSDAERALIAETLLRARYGFDDEYLDMIRENRGAMIATYGRDLYAEAQKQAEALIAAGMRMILPEGQESPTVMTMSEVREDDGNLLLVTSDAVDARGVADEGDTITRREWVRI